MKKMMIISLCAISLVGIVGLALTDNAEAQYGYYSPKEPTKPMDHTNMDHTNMDHTSMDAMKMADGDMNMKTEKMMTGHKMSPIKQISAGVLPKDIVCNEGHVLIFSPIKNPACVRP